MNRLFQCAAVAALLFGAVPMAAQAQTVALPNGLYVGVDVGAIVPQSISIHGSSGGITINGDLKFDTGVATGVMLGYHVTPVIAVEGNFEYAGFDLRSLSVSVPGVGSASAGLQGRFDTFNGLFNAIWTPLGPAGRYGISPYIGAGMGFSHISESLTAITAGGITVTGNASDDVTDFAANGIIGADFPIPFMPQLTAGVRYRLLFINTASSGSSAGVFGSSGNFFGHVFTANATYHF